MRTTFICSPYSGEVERNTYYARQAMRDSFKRNEAPFAPHLLYTQVLDDSDPKQRNVGIKAGLHYMFFADVVAVYNDYGISPGMEKEIAAAMRAGIPVEYRKLL
jgi:hypothetical protein